MAPESCQEAEDAEEEAFPSLVDRELVSGHVGPPASASADPGAPACPQDTKPSCTRMVSSVSLQSVPESLDPRTLRLLWRQRELEIQALRWAIENHREARHCRILQEVAGLPAERSSRSRKFLQNQVQKLTLELEEHKEQAQLEKAHLEERLLQTGNTLRQLEVELQALQKSCLLQLARSSWVGRMLRSSTGSVEVVTAETLMDPSDLSENDRSPTAGEGFRLEDVDWNSIAHRYPNLFTDLESSLDQNRLGPATSPVWDLTLAWCCSSPTWNRRALWARSGLTGDVPSGRSILGFPSWTGRLSLDLRKTHSDRQGSNGQEAESCADPHPRHSGRCPSPAGSCLKIVAVSRRRRFVRILNHSLEETADLGGFVLQQLVRDFPVCMYRFPPSTLLEPRHHITVWGEAPGSTKRQPPSSLGQEPVHFHSSRGCVTLLLNPQGEVLSEHQAAHCVTPVCRIFSDNTDLSIDRFPLSEARPGADLAEQQPLPRLPRKGRVQEARAGRRRPGTRVQLPRLSTSKLLRQREVPARPEGAAETHPELLPASPIPIPEAGLGLEDCQARKELKVRVSAGAGVRAAPAPPRPAPPPPPPPPCGLSGSAPPGAPEERGPRLSDGGAFGAEHGREQVRLPLPQLPAHHRGLALAGVGPGRAAAPAPVLPRLHDCGCGAGRGESAGGRRCQLHSLLNERRLPSKPHFCTPDSRK
ncbi:lamin tail domain-containing protein 2 isoform X1 [Balaenoptera musculus]|uniref:Lamin tail domain-containing protein 2 isoform X1 n=1 Tax=Balaenoptera musculus TaxID=9771 RepID=A0A8B8Y2D5_BALMU|nr:lamin tail domain-containing protein 2 isoform X1 [Balaenoptera musculus]